MYNGKNYEQTTNVADRIRSGEYQIERLDSAGEQGRLRGGQRNVEASLILAADEAAGGAASGNNETGLGSLADTVRRGKRLLEQYAKRSNSCPFLRLDKLDIFFKKSSFLKFKS